MTEIDEKKDVNRRDFMKGVAIGVGATALSEFGVSNAHAAENGIKVLIVYYSKEGSTAKAAAAVGVGANKVPGAVVSIRKAPGSATIEGQQIPDVSDEDLVSADCILLGSPVYWANPAPEILKVIQDPKLNFYDKFGGAFATGAQPYGGMGIVINQLLLAMIHKCMVVTGIRKKKWGFGDLGAGAPTFPPSKGVEDNELQVFNTLGEHVVAAARQWKLGITAS